MLGNQYERQDCSIARALEVIGERWTLLIVRDAFHGVRRFNDFQEHLDIPRAVLSDRLAGLVDEGVMTRRVDPAHGGRHLYELTAAGRDLWPVIHALMMWGGRHHGRNSLRFRHAACGTLLDAGGACPECMVTPRPARHHERARAGAAASAHRRRVGRVERPPPAAGADRRVAFSADPAGRGSSGGPQPRSTGRPPGG
jgi:DNA-binding HxlR family transcriptional regulator